MPDTNPEKDKIIKFAQQKFFSEGFYKTTMDEISRELQMSKKTIYKYFLSKEKLVEEITDIMLNDANCEIEAIVDSDDSVVIKFVKMLNRYMTNVSKFSERWYRDLQVHTPHIWKKIETLREEKIVRGSKKLIEQGKREKLIEHYPAEIIIAAFISTIRTVMNPGFILANKFSMQQAFKYTFELLLNGILTPQGKELYEKTKLRFEKELGKQI
jgi:AcrR family transcriptional regulator